MMDSLLEDAGPAGGGETALHRAAERGDPADLRARARAGPAGVDARDGAGATPLHYAATRGHVAAGRALLELGAELLEDAGGASPAHWAASNGKAEFLALLEGAEPGVLKRVTNERRTLLHASCRAGQIEAARWLLERGAAVDAVDVRGNTPLHDACRANHAALVRLLLERGADALATTAANETAPALATARKVRDLFRAPPSPAPRLPARGRVEVAALPGPAGPATPPRGRVEPEPTPRAPTPPAEARPAAARRSRMARPSNPHVSRGAPAGRRPLQPAFRGPAANSFVAPVAAFAAPPAVRPASPRDAAGNDRIRAASSRALLQAQALPSGLKKLTAQPALESDFDRRLKLETRLAADKYRHKKEILGMLAPAAQKKWKAKLLKDDAPKVLAKAPGGGAARFLEKYGLGGNAVLFSKGWAGRGAEQAPLS